MSFTQLPYLEDYSIFSFWFFFVVVAKAQISLFLFADNTMNISSISTIFPSLLAYQPLLSSFVRHFLIVEKKTEYLFCTLNSLILVSILCNLLTGKLPK